ncbi:MAG TPA: hypothetical protein VF065_14225, partial [Ilumatobacter sp.]
RGDRFAMTVDGRHWPKRAGAGEHLRQTLAQRLASTPPGTTSKHHPIGQVARLEIHAQALTTIEDELRILIPDIGTVIRFVGAELDTRDPVGLIRSIEHPIHRLPTTIADHRQHAQDAREEANRAETRRATPRGATLRRRRAGSAFGAAARCRDRVWPHGFSRVAALRVRGRWTPGSVRRRRR